jgi:hypothetical protein
VNALSSFSPRGEPVRAVASIATAFAAVVPLNAPF